MALEILSLQETMTNRNYFHDVLYLEILQPTSNTENKLSFRRTYLEGLLAYV
jgi:hypothetical protein